MDFRSKKFPVLLIYYVHSSYFFHMVYMYHTG